MNKKIIYIIGFLILITISSPWIDGFFFKRNFYKAIKAINEDERIKLEVLSYHEGFFTTSAKIKITIINRELNNIKQINVPQYNFNFPVSFVLSENVQHGPFTFSAYSPYFSFSHAHIDSTLSIERNNEEIMKVDVLAGFNGHWTGNFYSPMLSFTLPLFDKVTIAGLKGSFLVDLIDHRIHRVRTNMQTGALLITGAKNNPLIKQMSIEPIRSRYDAVHESKGLWSGSSSAFTQTMIVTGSDNIHYLIDKFAINSTFSLGENIFYNYNLAIFMRNVTSKSKTIPAFSKLQMRFSAKNFNVKGINEYIYFIKSKTPEEMKNIDINKVEDLLAHTIDKESTINFFVAADTSLGPFSFIAKSDWPANKALPDTFLELAKNSYTMINFQLSNSLVVKLLTIYGDEIMATSEVQLAGVKKEELFKMPIFYDQRTEANGEFHQKVDQLLQQNLLPIPVSLQLLSLEKDKPSIDDFTLQVDLLKIPNDIKTQIIASYQLQMQNTNQLFISDKITRMIDDLVSISYLKKDQDHFHSEIVIEGGIFKINGSPILPQK